MPSFSIARAKKFIDRALKVPLFAHVGEPFEAEDAIRVSSVAEYVKSMRADAWDKVCQNALNHHSARIRDVYGAEWFQKRNNAEVERIWEELDSRGLERVIKRAWKRIGIPENIDPYIDTTQWAYNFVSGVAYDHALGFTAEDSFHMKYIEPWLLGGHLPCGWSGRVPAEPDKRDPWAGLPLEAAVGAGKLKIY